MITRFIQATGAVVVVVACLSAPVALLAIGNQFRIAARMADPTPGADLADAAVGDGIATIQIATVADQAGRW